MKTESKAWISIVLATFLAGALYGGLWKHCVADGPQYTRPPTAEEWAGFKASMPCRQPGIEFPVSTNVNQSLQL